MGSFTGSSGMSTLPSKWAVNVVMRTKGNRLAMRMRAEKWACLHRLMNTFAPPAEKSTNTCPHQTKPAFSSALLSKRR
jgi:hypothetical protein